MVSTYRKVTHKSWIDEVEVESEYWDEEKECEFCDFEEEILEEILDEEECEDITCYEECDEDEEEYDWKQTTPEEKVIDLLKGGFERRCGISLDEFTRIYHELLEHSPEKLI